MDPTSLYLAIVLLLALGGALAMGWYQSPLALRRRQAQALVTELVEDLRSPGALLVLEDQGLATLAGGYAQQARAQRLADLPIESLKSMVQGRVRWSALREAGIDTVAEATAWTAGSLQNLKGVGPATAGRVTAAVREVVHQVELEPVKPPTDLGSARAQSLVAAAGRVVTVEQALGDLPARTVEQTAILRDAMADIRRKTSFRSWISGGARAREDASVAADALFGTLEGRPFGRSRRRRLPPEMPPIGSWRCVPRGRRWMQSTAPTSPLMRSCWNGRCQAATGTRMHGSRRWRAGGYPLVSRVGWSSRR